MDIPTQPLADCSNEPPPVAIAAPKVVLHADHREHQAKSIMVQPDIEWSNLTHGDFVVSIDGAPRVVVERKTLSDLAASIKDGRYSNQKKRLLATYPPSHVIYLIEGNIVFCNSPCLVGGIPYDTLLSAVLNTCVRDGIHVVVTKNLLDTCGFVEQLYKRIRDDPAKYMCTRQVTNEPPNTVLKSVPRNASKRECFVAQLCQVPGISHKSASAIAERYPDAKSLVLAIVEQGRQALSDVKTTDSKGKQRSLSSAVVSTVFDIFS